MNINTKRSDIFESIARAFERDGQIPDDPNSADPWSECYRLAEVATEAAWRELHFEEYREDAKAKRLAKLEARSLEVGLMDHGRGKAMAALELLEDSISEVEDHPDDYPAWVGKERIR